MNTPPTDPQTLNYYLLRTNDSEPEGPFTAAVLQRMFTAGDLLGAEFVATEGSENWEMLSHFLRRVFPIKPKPPSIVQEWHSFWITEASGMRGPFTIAQVRKQWDAGSLTLLTKFRVAMDEEDRPLSDIRQLLEPPAPQPAAIPLPTQNYTARAPEPARKGMSLASGCLVVFTLFMIVFIGVPLLFGPKTPSRESAIQRGYHDAEDAVRDRLKSPSTAQFVSSGKGYEESGDYVFYRVVVDSQNGFGAMIRGTFRVKATINSDNKGITVLAVDAIK